MWLFGSGKKKTPEVYVSGVTSEGFTQVSTGPPPSSLQQQQQPSTISSYESPIPPYPVLPYNLLPQTSYTPPKLPTVNRPPANPLDSLPFRLAKELQQGNHLNVDYQFAKETLDKIKGNIINNTYNYDFTLEKSVIHEDTSRICIS